MKIKNCVKIVKIKQFIETLANIVLILATFVALIVSVIQVIGTKKDK